MIKVFLRMFVWMVQLFTNTIRRILKGKPKEIPWSPVLILNIPFSAEEFLGEVWREVPRDPNVPILESIDITKVIFFGNCLSPQDRQLTGYEKRARLMVPGCILFDARVFMALLTEKSQQTLEWIHKKNGATRLDFFGTILVNQTTKREYVLYLFCKDEVSLSPALLSGRWDYGFDPLDMPWNSECLSGILAPHANVTPLMPEPKVPKPISRVQPSDLSSRGLGRYIRQKGSQK